MVFQFNLPTTTTAATGFSFGQPAATTTAAEAAKPAFSFGTPAAAGDAAAKPLGLGLATSTPATAAVAPAKTLPTLGLGAPVAPQATAAPAATTTASFSFGAPTAAPTTTASSSFSFGAPTASSTASTTAATTKSTLSTGLAPAATSAPATSTGFASLTTATKTTDSSAVSNASQMSFNQVEEYINKWTLELEEQEKIFLDQATQINAWDKVLNSNSNLVLELNDAVQKVMAEQSTLECELAYIENQHRDVDENIQILEKEFTKLPQVDVERSQAYLLVENLDTQLKQMSEDLKEIIDSLNESSQIGDSTDPIIQVGKILNAHMSSLQWIEATTTKVAKKLDEVDKMHEKYKRDNDRVRNSYYH